MISQNINILLADDDRDDCLLFKEALGDIQLNTTLTLVHDGQKLIQLLSKKSNIIFDVLFLDINMPRKNGFKCLQEIKKLDNFKSIPVIIFSTSYDQSSADQLYSNGAYHYICKPADFIKLRNIIHQALFIVSEKSNLQPPKEKFLLSDLKANLL